MRRYETLFIVQVDLPDDELSNLIERYSSIITAFKGTVVKTEKWGKRKLAYPIKHFNEGYYILGKFRIRPSATKEIEANLLISEEIIRFLLVKIE